MAYTREVKSIQNDLQKSWQGIRASINKMQPSSQIRPAEAADIFAPDAASAEAKFNIGPVVSRVKFLGHLVHRIGNSKALVQAG